VPNEHFVMLRLCDWQSLMGDEPEDIDTPESQGKNPHASAMGKMGAAARAKSTTSAQRKAIAKKAAAKRWKK
jgi:hypothetical protein